MNLLEKVYLALHKASVKPQERGIYSAGRWQSIAREKVSGMISKYRGRFLEIGCGSGLFLAYLNGLKESVRVFAVERAFEALGGARKTVLAKRINNVSLLNCDGQALAFKDASFDAVICVNLFICLESEAAAANIIHEASRVCRKGGALIVEFRSKSNPFLRIKYKLAKYYDPTARNHPFGTYYERNVVRMLQRRGFAIERKHYIAFPLKWLAPINIIEARKI